MKDKEFYQLLVKRYMENKATDKELEAFFHYLGQGVLDEHIAAYMDAGSTAEQIHNTGATHDADDTSHGRKLRRTASLPAAKPARKIWLAAAALLAALLLAGGGIYLFRNNSTPLPQGTLAAAPQQEIAPGTDNAVLTLADGSTITLDSTSAGSLSIQGNTNVIQQAGGKLAYRLQGAASSQIVQYNTLTTPRGGKYQLTLPDGTTVLLNAASSLRFPVAFPGKTREVVLNGEAYFEVAENAAQPFRVRLQEPGEVIEVLGTSFNVMAYRDEPPVKTTLVTGKVKVTSNGKAALLAPGEQAVMAADIKVQKASIEEALAWKNNEFYFSNTNIYSVMRQISRWYDVDVKFEDSLQVYLNGNIRKNVNASQVFKMLELTGEVRFSTNGKEVTVSARR
ncbi:FecR family protein [Chitinophaga cymbidii]|uniref:Iron dicitrate transporter FecR n=1 Tax=Chitinophaga cymbidii TaxID=1096750 RepID=A0A512RND3_9BACT|nr:FecR family protein [Chitinophaga cymbidii]GEP97202.1 iron dicitrate transporter FecR [Chitinophaga cymbidii]